MPDPTLSAAIREAYASAPVDLIVYHTLEIWHPGFSDPIRVVRDRVALDARLEPGAPRNAGEIVTFAPFAFEIEPPDQTATGAPQCRVEIDNVGREIGAALDLAVAGADPVTLIYRQYLSDALADGPETDPAPELTFTSASADMFRVRGTAGFPDLLDKQFPGLVYTLETYPGLAT